MTNGKNLKYIPLITTVWTSFISQLIKLTLCVLNRSQLFLQLIGYNYLVAFQYGIMNCKYLEATLVLFYIQFCYITYSNCCLMLHFHALLFPGFHILLILFIINLQKEVSLSFNKLLTNLTQIKVLSI